MKLLEKIAMKISEEEYKSILPILKENKLLIAFSSTWTHDWSYLVNVDDYKRNLISVNLLRSVMNYKILPYNKELFLQYCGIEVGKEETFEEYTNRVNPSLYTSFLAEQELRSKELKIKSIYKTYDGVDVIEGIKVAWVIDNEFKYILSLCKNHVNGCLQDESYKVFSTQEAAEQYVAENTPQKTIDCFEIVRGEDMWVVDTQFFKLHQSVGGHFKKDNGKHLLFKHKENAINHIVLNKLTLSLKDLDFIVGFGEERMNLIKKVKEKLGFS